MKPGESDIVLTLNDGSIRSKNTALTWTERADGVHIVFRDLSEEFISAERIVKREVLTESD